MITIMETIRAMWESGKQRADVDRQTRKLSDEAYFAVLEQVVLGIKDHLKRHQLLAPQTSTVKHGDSTVQVTVDLPSMRVRRDPEDPSRAIFEIPATQA